jgi:O-antigen/teichoic acid export membrane protein
MKTISGNLLLKNSVYNLAGSIAPLFVALFAIPLLVNGLGVEKFGILSLAWVVIGYFSFFDFGIGRALTKIIAEKIGLSKLEEIPGIFWTSFYLMLAISFLGTITLFFLTPYLISQFFNITKNLQQEAINTFYVLAISIPIVTTSAGLRGVLEAYHKFGIINIIRVVLGVFTFLGPLLCLIFTNSLFWIVVFLTFIRIIIWGLYFIQCLKLHIDGTGWLKFETKLVKPIFRLSGWMTVSNLIGPLITYADRFLIGALISAAAITYYATPYEVVTKILIIPGALTSVLFPVFSANYLTSPDLTKKLLFKGIKYISIILYPIVLLIITFASEGLNLWLGQKFSDSSSLIMQLFAAGILFNSIAFIPFTFLQGIGRPDLTAKLHLTELPLYLIVMWFATKRFGINGAGIVWLIRIILDTLILSLITKKIISFKTEFNFKLSYFLVTLLIIALVFAFFITGISIKILTVFIILILYVITSWNFLLLRDERMFITSYIKGIISKSNLFYNNS